MLRYATYVKFSLHGLLWALEEARDRADPAQLDRLAARHAALSADYDAFIALAAALPRFPEAIFERVFPHRHYRGELGLRINPADAAETLFCLEHFAAHPLAHWPLSRLVFPYHRADGSYRIFSYTICVRFVPDPFCNLSWYYEYEAGACLPVSLRLPPALFADGVDPATGILRDALFLPGIVPRVAQWTNASGRYASVRFPRAYRPCDDGPGIILTWRDLPLFAALTTERQAA